MTFIVARIGKQPIYVGDIQSDIHSSKRKSDRLKEKIRMKRQKIFDQGFLGDNGATNGIDTRTRSFNGISKDYKDHGDPIYKCADCDALLWHAESVVGSTHSNSGSFSLCCSRGKVQNKTHQLIRDMGHIVTEYKAKITT
ncbi:hypothetical protein CTI12_AA197200 [Artemisia annua]|uniref:Uncharacterized protein n=1 Tax=Artemisia annua TaxID=35608 RepID=A0A2U1P4Q0_ARTAN|nr:hypothetical protein CTI12_AA197200 [Artemisia annua]